MQSLSDPSYHTTQTDQKPSTATLAFEPFSLSPEGGLIYIEQFHRNCSCETPKRPWMIASNFFTGQSIFFQPTCKKWSCAYCGQINAKRWIVRAIKGTEQLLSEGWKVDFVTITSHEKLTAAQSFYVLPRAWKTLHMRYKREIPGDDPGAYYAVPETHLTGVVHSHLIITGGLRKKWWKDNARECGLGYQSEVKEVITLGVGGYVSKYLGKTLDESWAKGKRRVNTSRSWPAMPELEQTIGWGFKTYYSDQELLPVIESLLKDGYTVTGVTTANAWVLLERLSPMIEPEI